MRATRMFKSDFDLPSSSGNFLFCLVSCEIIVKNRKQHDTHGIIECKHMCSAGCAALHEISLHHFRFYRNSEWRYFHSRVLSTFHLHSHSIRICLDIPLHTPMWANEKRLNVPGWEKALPWTKSFWLEVGMRRQWIFFVWILLQKIIIRLTE